MTSCKTEHAQAGRIFAVGNRIIPARIAKSQQRNRVIDARTVITHDKDGGTIRAFKIQGYSAGASAAAVLQKFVMLFGIRGLA